MGDNNLKWTIVVKSMSFKKISELVRNVDGWLSEGEAKYLYALARFGPGQGAVVEIGSWKGKSTIVLASGSAAADRETVYAIDPHKGGPDQESIGLTGVDTEAEFRRNIKSAGVDSRVVPMVTHSTEAAKNWDQPVRLLWIDGDHSYDAVKNDFLSWEPFVIVGV